MIRAISHFRFPQKLVLLLFFCGACLFACDDTSDSAQEQDQVSTDSTEAESITEENADCPPGIHIICNGGLAFASLGETIAGIEASELGDVEMADSVDFEMGYVRLNRSFSSEEGMILLEGDAIVESEATDELISASGLSRIRIEVSRFHTPDGVHPGMSIKELQELYGDGDIFIDSFSSIEQFQNNPDYEFLILNPARYPNITYLLPDPGHKIFRSIGKTEVVLSELPLESKISSIVVSV